MNHTYPSTLQHLSFMTPYSACLLLCDHSVSWWPHSLSHITLINTLRTPTHHHYAHTLQLINTYTTTRTQQTGVSEEQCGRVQQGGGGDSLDEVRAEVSVECSELSDRGRVLTYMMVVWCAVLCVLRDEYGVVSDSEAVGWWAFSEVMEIRTLARLKEAILFTVRSWMFDSSWQHCESV